MDIEGLKERLSAKRFALDDVVPLAEEAVKAIESLQRELSRKDGTIATISNALSFAERQSAERNSKAQTLENENRRLKLDLEELKHDLPRLMSAASSEATLVTELQRENAELKSAIDRQARSAIAGMNAAKSHAHLMLSQAEKMRAESKPDLISSERAVNSALTDEVERLQRELEGARRSLCEAADLIPLDVKVDVELMMKIDAARNQKI